MKCAGSSTNSAPPIFYSLPASQEAFGKLKGDNKELLIIPGASHTDLYDRMDIIPFDKIEAFFRKYLR